MGPVLARVPGIAGQQAQPTSSCRQPIWHTLKTHSDEQAVLLFCPTPTRALPDEATWRLLAQLFQTPFYQRLRVELRSEEHTSELQSLMSISYALFCLKKKTIH